MIDALELMSPGLQLPLPSDLPVPAAVCVGRQPEPVDARTARWRAIELLNGLLDAGDTRGRLSRADRQFLLDAAELEETTGRDREPSVALQLVRAEVGRIAASVGFPTPDADRPPPLAPDNAAAWE